MPNDPNRRAGDRGAGPGSRGNRPPSPPPGGAAGAAQQTAAAQLTGFMFAPGFGRAATRPPRKRRAGRRSMPRVTRRKARGSKKRKGAKFVKGSAAAKRHMAKLRRMQKRRRG